MKQGAELTTAFVDLITGIALIPFVVILLKKRGSGLTRKWTRLLAALSAAHVGGFVAHAFLWPQPAYDVYWIFLYAGMYLLLVFAADLAFFKAAGRSPGRATAIVFLCVMTAAYSATAVSNFFIEKDIVIFLFAAALVGLPSLAVIGWTGAGKRDVSGTLILVSLIPQLIGLPFMFAQTGVVFSPFGVPFDHNGVYHVCLLITLVIVSFAALRDGDGEKTVAIDPET